MTTNFQLLRLCKNIPHFRGVFMISEFSRKKRKDKHEKAIVNIGSGGGTHWVAYRRNGNKVAYFDSYGDLSPPKQLIKYFGKRAKISYNRRRYQSYSSDQCGQLCVKFLKNQ